MIHYLNLSNGLIHKPCCEHSHYTRIQSTHLEQKLWNEVIYGAGPDFLYHLVTEKEITIHDESEKPRRTRAMWQGIPFIILAFQSIHHLKITPAIMRNNFDATSYFLNEIETKLTKQTKNYIKYWKKYNIRNKLANVYICDKRYTHVS